LPVTAAGDVANVDFPDVTSAQFAICSEIEQRAVAALAFVVEPRIAQTCRGFSARLAPNSIRPAAVISERK
jgi:hypothetical protein